MMVLAIMEVLPMTAQLNVQLHYNFVHNFYGESHKKKDRKVPFFLYMILNYLNFVLRGCRLEIFEVGRNRIGQIQKFASAE